MNVLKAPPSYDDLLAANVLSKRITPARDTEKECRALDLLIGRLEHGELTAAFGCFRSRRLGCTPFFKFNHTNAMLDVGVHLALRSNNCHFKISGLESGRANLHQSIELFYTACRRAGTYRSASVIERTKGLNIVINALRRLLALVAGQNICQLSAIKPIGRAPGSLRRQQSSLQT